MVAVNSAGQLDVKLLGKKTQKITREPIFLPICLKSRTHSSPRWLSFKGKADTASTLNLNCETLSTFKRSRLLAAAGLTRRRERGPRGRGLCVGRGTRVGAPGCGRRGAESPCVLHVRSEASSLRPSAHSAIPEVAIPWGVGSHTTQGKWKKPVLVRVAAAAAWRRRRSRRSLGYAGAICHLRRTSASPRCPCRRPTRGQRVLPLFFFSPPKEKTCSDSPEQKHITPACSDGESAGLRRNIKWWDSSSGNARLAVYCARLASVIAHPREKAADNLAGVCRSFMSLRAVEAGSPCNKNHLPVFFLFFFLTFHILAPLHVQSI